LLMSDALSALGSLFLKSNRLSLAKDHYERGKTLREVAGDPIRIASSLNNLAVVAGMTGNFADAAETFERVYDLASQYGQDWTAAAALVNRGHALTECNNTEQAHDSYVQGVGEMRTLGDKHGTLGALLGVIHSAAAEGKTAVLASSVVEWIEVMGRPGSVRDTSRLSLPTRVTSEKVRSFGHPDLANKMEQTLQRHLDFG